MPHSVSYKNQKKSSSLTKIPFSAMTCFRAESEKVTIFVPASVGATNVLNGFPETAVHTLHGVWAHAAFSKDFSWAFRFCLSWNFWEHIRLNQKTKIIAIFVPF
jgi:hypothetical protein